MNEFFAVVGTTGHSRKGDAKNAALRPLQEADPDWAASIASGLSSGEGLIHAVRDPVEKIAATGKNKGERYIADEGVTDKRCLVVETEFAGPLQCLSREGNTLSPVLRDAWDSRSPLRTLTRTTPIRATGPHISVIGHTTPEDLGAHLGDLEIANGLGNRFIYVLVNRARLLPNPARPQAEEAGRLVEDVREALFRARGVGEIRRTAAADRLWGGVYPELTKDEPGLTGKLLARSEAHVARLSALYALIAHANQIDVEHLESALALWDYAEASVRTIFARRTGNKIADRIRHELLPGETKSLTEIRDQMFSNHVSAAGLQEALDLLSSLGDVDINVDRTPGRPKILVTRLEPGSLVRTNWEQQQHRTCA